MHMSPRRSRQSPTPTLQSAAYLEHHTVRMHFWFLDRGELLTEKRVKITLVQNYNNPIAGLR